MIERVIIRPVENAPVLSVVIVFIGLLVIFNSIAGWIYRYTIIFVVADRLGAAGDVS